MRFSSLLSNTLLLLQLAVTQSISGTGALRIGTAFFARHYPGAKAIYLPTPTWGNHMSVLLPTRARLHLGADRLTSSCP
jgi:aspartate/tyrosine/aromatic aminotransferase